MSNTIRLLREKHLNWSGLSILGKKSVRKLGPVKSWLAWNRWREMFIC